MSDYDTILVERSGPIATLTINRPDKLNALDPTVIRELTRAVYELGGDADVRVGIVTGAGDKAFVAGADIEAMSEMSPLEAKQFSDAGHRLCWHLEQAPLPFIAAVNGFALGGGTELALACDFIYASEKARFGQPEVSLGLMPGFGGTQRLARRVGIARAREIIYTGDHVRADEAHRIGLANRVVAPGELMNAAREAAAKIAAVAPIAVRSSKRVMALGADTDLATACELEASTFAGLFGTADQREGTKAFLEKRKPRFEGR